MMGSYQKEGAVHGVTFFVTSSLMMQPFDIRQLAFIFPEWRNPGSSNKTFLITIELHLKL